MRPPFLSTFQSQPSVLSADSPRQLSTGVFSDWFGVSGGGGMIGAPGASWDSLWEQVPRFRHIWRVATAIWGLALLIDAAIRVLMAYTLPIDLVPALGGALWPVTFIALQVVVNAYFQRAGFWRILRGET